MSTDENNNGRADLNVPCGVPLTIDIDMDQAIPPRKRKPSWQEVLKDERKESKSCKMGDSIKEDEPDTREIKVVVSKYESKDEIPVTSTTTYYRKNDNKEPGEKQPEAAAASTGASVMMARAEQSPIKAPQFKFGAANPRTPDKHVQFKVETQEAPDSGQPKLVPKTVPGLRRSPRLNDLTKLSAETEEEGHLSHIRALRDICAAFLEYARGASTRMDRVARACNDITDEISPLWEKLRVLRKRSHDIEEDFEEKLGNANQELATRNMLVTMTTYSKGLFGPPAPEDYTG